MLTISYFVVVIFLFLQLFNSNACCFCYLCWCCWWCSCYCGRYLLLMLLPLFKFSFGANIQNSLFVSWVFLCRIGSRIIIYVCISLVCSLALSAYLSAHKCNILCTFATISFSVRFNAISFDSRQFCTPSFLLDFAFFFAIKTSLMNYLLSITIVPISIVHTAKQCFSTII